MVALRELPQRLEVLGGEQQHEQAREQREFAGRPELQEPEQREPYINRDQADCDRAEELHYRGGEKGHSQHPHAQAPVAMRGGGHFGPGGVQREAAAQQVEVTDAVQEVPGEPVLTLLLLFVDLLTAHADQGHEHRDQRCGQEQQQPGDPVQRKGGGQQQQRHCESQPQCRQVAREIPAKGVDLFLVAAGPGAGMPALAEMHRADAGGGAGEAGTQLAADREGETLSAPVAQRLQPIAQDRRRQCQPKPRPGAGLARGEQALVDQPRDAAGKRDGGGRRAEAGKPGQVQPAPVRAEQAPQEVAGCRRCGGSRGFGRHWSRAVTRGFRMWVVRRSPPKPSPASGTGVRGEGAALGKR
ncbi:Cytochrome d ubiquinol oxidase subunit I [Thioalkalivibrio nitratireducens DSM 14787]|uniref:Cytochrome d ubiquinol oxidase subunit I n=1 Tax=Thioalkalivibrio nitratireducens (strain DSM 14787 / UNIQEM 213 / ALEN2) TaxID=1255043 RepID=L0DYS9_THIND|nr:Cytochrome d ubiquinol oxidase subunit I [Thioalkalivibrio nitratireducens DSM 14787]